MPFNRINALFNPDLYHGWGISRNYFEGWYFKIINQAESRFYAIIPGISMNSEGEKHSFIQILDGANLTSEYHTFRYEDFEADSGKFHVQIGNNHFSNNHIKLDIEGFRGGLNFSGRIPWPTAWYSPGVMGPYSFVPFMECNHGILSMDHSLAGELVVNNEVIDFTGGKGYTEKDWGKSFPGAYIWMQSNHFSQENISFKISVAKIPWLGSSFVGFISGLWFDDKVIEFTTYNSSRLRRVAINDDAVLLILENKKYILEVRGKRALATKLASPISGNMTGHIHESMRSELDLKLIARAGGNVLLEVKGRNLALEVAGAFSELLTG